MPKKKKKRKEHIIIGYLPEDEYELPRSVYLSFWDMANHLNISEKHAENIVIRGGVFKKTNLWYRKVRCDY